jgi:hypothetical protein
MLVETTFHIIASGRVADVDRWTETLGINPHAVARRGEHRGSAPSVDSWWAYIFDKRQVASAEEPLLQLLDLLAPRASAIAAMAAAEGLEVSITSYVWEPVQGLAVDLSPTAVKALAQVGCSYAVVVYE